MKCPSRSDAEGGETLSFRYGTVELTAGHGVRAHRNNVYGVTAAVAFCSQSVQETRHGGNRVSQIVVE